MSRQANLKAQKKSSEKRSVTITSYSRPSRMFPDEQDRRELEAIREWEKRSSTVTGILGEPTEV